MSNLLDKSSIVLTPTAYDNGKVLCVKPSDGSGDFDFSRNSAATRVNAQGLVEDVQILSSNLVQNGSFSQLGSEEITNGSFVNGETDWVFTSGASLTALGAKITHTPTAGQISQDNSLVIGKNYKFTYEITESVSGGLKLNSAVNTPMVTSIGVHTKYFEADDTTFIVARTNAASNDVTITNISVKEVGQDWTFGTNWTIDQPNSKATSDGSQLGNVSLKQSNSLMNLVDGRLYEAKFTISEYVSGAINPHLRGVPSGNVSGNGIKTSNIIAGNNSDGVNLFADANFAGSVSDISVIEITNDTNLPRINYEGFSYDGSGNIIPDSGCGSWLWEPQSTNLVTNSSKGEYGNPPASEILATAPDGSNDAIRPVPDSFSDRYQYNIGGGSYATDSKLTYSWYRRRISTPVNDTYVGDLHIQILVNCTQVGVTTEIESNINGYDRFSATFSITDGSLNSILRFYFGRIIGTGNSSVAYWGHQLEAQTYSTSLIPTDGTSVTRNQDLCNNGGTGTGLINSTSGVLYAEIAANSDDLTGRVISLSDGTSNERIVLSYNNSTNKIRCFIKSGGSFFATLDKVVADEKQFHKVAYKYKSGETKLFVDGNLVDTSTDAFTITGLDVLQFANGTTTTQPFFGKTKAVAVWKEPLSDEELAELTTI